MAERYVGLDIGAETVKAVELRRSGNVLRLERRAIVEHHKEPASALLDLLRLWDWTEVDGAAATGRFAELVALPSVPTKHALASGFRALEKGDAATIVSIGSHGFSVLELRESGAEVYRENSRCSQGTGNFLRQLVARFDLDIEEASTLCDTVEDPAPLSGRCPVILKTDMTHLANKGESKARILAGLYDAVCENVQVLIKPLVSPPQVLLAGGVSRSARIRRHFTRFLARHDMVPIEVGEDDQLYLEALGSAVEAAGRTDQPPPPLDALLAAPRATSLERVPALREHLERVRRMEPLSKAERNGEPWHLLLGFDIGSTGSKLVAFEGLSRTEIWEGYVNTNGNPVGAAQELMRAFVEGPAGKRPVFAIGVTGSGREIVGSLLSSCFGVDRVYVLNEIAAHAEGALFFDERVDTIFEIGGQDAKYIRLAGGRVIDAAMNEACSAGTGSFIEEQGRKFGGIRDVVHLGDQAIEADSGVSLGQHCSVFMAEIIDEAVAAGVERDAIIAGIYDSIIQNYLNRVKGSRSVGDVIFCQGMPFASDALAAAVARQTGSEVIVPPNPGTVGALGIALLTLKAIPASSDAAREPLDPRRLLGARVESKDTFVCKSTRGCGGSGNRCRIDRIATVIEEQRKKFTWGGGCSLWDRGTGKTKLPDLTPDPFRRRDEIALELTAEAIRPRGRPRIALSDEFQLKALFPFFATFLSELGFDLDVERGADQSALKRGIEQANIPFCAPMQQFHGLAGKMSEGDAEFLFVPMLRSIPRVGEENHAVVCPIVQASPDILRWDLPAGEGPRVVSPIIDFGEGNLDSREFLESCKRTAVAFGAGGRDWKRAHAKARAVQERFETACLEAGREALEFCEENDVTPVIVLGRTYTIYNTVLNSNVPALLREQGALAIPVDCYPVDDDVPVFRDVFWGYGQRNLRAAHQVRRTPGQYTLWCSNYSCGPDSFNLHFYAFTMEGKPFAIIETDGHSGDAGTKTRVEAFLHCVREDLASERYTAARELDLITADRTDLPALMRSRRRVLVPRMGPGAAALAACLRGVGVPAEALPLPDRETLRIGRRYTSGKECVPMCITLGSLLQRVQAEADPDLDFAFFMPTGCGPCRFGAYNVLHRIVLERVGLSERVTMWSPVDADYFGAVPPGFAALAMIGFVATDLLLEGLYDARPVELQRGAAQEIHDRFTEELLATLESAAGGDLSARRAVSQVVRAKLYGVTALLQRAAHAYAAIKSDAQPPAVLVVGETYVRCDPFANDFVIDKLERHGVRARFVPFNEWLEYTDWAAWQKGQKRGLKMRLKSWMQRRIQEIGHETMAAILDWPDRMSVREVIGAGAEYLRPELFGDAILSLGGPIHAWRAGLVDGAVNVGPLECMPTKLAETQLFHAGEREELPSLTLPMNGDPLDPAVLDRFVYEVKQRYSRRTRSSTTRANADTTSAIRS